MVRGFDWAHSAGAFSEVTSQKVLTNRLIYIKIEPGTGRASAVLHKLFLLFQLDCRRDPNEKITYRFGP